MDDIHFPLTALVQLKIQNWQRFYQLPCLPMRGGRLGDTWVNYGGVSWYGVTSKFRAHSATDRW